MKILNKHSAPGQMAGYMFQPERALYWLAASQRGAIIGIETSDDVVRLSQDGNENTIFEQDKHSTSDNIPFGDNSNDLWNTLLIWLKKVHSDNLDVNFVEFHMVTNKILKDCLAKRLGAASSENDIQKCIRELRDMENQVPESVKNKVKAVLSFSNEELYVLIKQIVVTDGSSSSYGEELKLRIISHLHTPESISIDEIYHSLLGWLHDTVLTLWRSGQPAWISRTSFDNQYWKVISKYQNKVFREKSKRLVPVDEAERKNQLHQDFVRQLYLLSYDENNVLLINAIDDFLRYKSEITRFSLEGDITKEDIIQFQDDLVERWELIFSKHKSNFLSNVNTEGSNVELLAKQAGSNVLTDTLDYKGTLAGQQTENYYITRGSYHFLSNQLEVGWHPEYKNELKKQEKSDEHAKRNGI